MDNDNGKWTIPLLLVAAGGIAAWLFWFDPDDAPPVADAPPATVPADDPAPRPGPVHPLPPATAPESTQGDLVPLPPLADSDAYFRLALLDVFGSNLDPLLVQDTLIEKFVATVDNLPRSQVSERMRPVGRLTDAFVADGSDVAQRYVLARANYARYDELVRLVGGADPDALVDTYRRFYPLLQEAYVTLGYPDGYFNDRVIEVIDHLIAAPEPEGEIILARPNVLYVFADPDLESLSAGQKLLVRMGNTNARRIKGQLRQLRALIAQTDP